jgi:hypothetical protein
VPDLPNRKQHEDELTAAIVLFFSRQTPLLLSGGPLLTGPYDGVTNALYSTAMEAGGGLAGQYGVSIEAVSPQAKQWAMGYAGALTKEITETTESMREAYVGPVTAGVVSGWMATLTMRAEMIGITETTRAATVGEDIGRQVIREWTGKILTSTWYTELDERVCDICGPLHGTGPEVYGEVSTDGPPAHPRCRCWLEYEYEGL